MDGSWLCLVHVFSTLGSWQMDQAQSGMLLISWREEKEMVNDKLALKSFHPHLIGQSRTHGIPELNRLGMYNSATGRGSDYFKQ